MRSIVRTFLAAGFALAASLLPSPSDAAVGYSVPSAGGTYVIGVYGGNIYTGFRAANGACTYTRRYYGVFLQDLVTISGTSGTDVIIVADAQYTLCDRTFYPLNLGSGGAVDVRSGDGNDWIIGKFRDAYAGAGNDIVSGHSYEDVQTLLGEGGNDYLYGGEEGQLNGGSNDDILCTLSGDTVYLFRGGTGYDRGCGPYQAIWNNDMEEVDQNCPEVCELF